MNCGLCGAAGLQRVYRAAGIPVFQNKVYPDLTQAREATTGDVELLACNHCGYVMNGAFDVNLMQYDVSYQNEQALSPTFDQYLDAVIDMLERQGFSEGRVVEVGCGKGSFLQKLWARGFTAQGFDTAYEGADPRIVCEYFGPQHADPDIDLIVLRHTLEHIENPLGFLQGLARLTGPQTQIYIEVPSLEWIVVKRAFWDIFYEHCNYFTQRSLAAMFGSTQGGLLFGNQYMYVVAPLNSVLERAAASDSPLPSELSMLQEKIDAHARFVREHSGMLVWGAGAKGSTFVNITDPSRRFIQAVVDINTRKAGNFIAGTGHPVITPTDIARTGAQAILVMNENYLDEIRGMLRELGLGDIVLFTLGHL